MSADKSDDFWDMAGPLLADGLVEEGTIMSSSCLRADGEFVAMPNHKGPGLVVKLHRDRVSELIAAGTGQPFAPAGKTFSEWVLIERFDDVMWTRLVTESVEFVSR